MNLRQIRIKLQQVTGRYDLVNTDGSDNGMDYYINSAQRFLDLALDNPKTTARYIVPLPAGSFFHIVRGARVIREVWLSNSDGRFKLEKQSLSKIRADYPTLYASAPDSNLSPPIFNVGDDSLNIAPSVWATTIVQLGPSLSSPLDAPNREFAFDFDGIVIGDHYAYVGIMLAPAFNAAYTLDVVGDFFQRQLSRDYDTSYWTVMHPDILVDAARMQIANDYSNREGVADMQATLQMKLRGIDADVVQELIATQDVMKG